MQLPDPIGKVFRDLGKVRGEAYNAFLMLPATDPLRPILEQVDKILSEAETNINKESQKAYTAYLRATGTKK